MPLIVAAAVVVLGGGAGAVFMMGGEDEPSNQVASASGAEETVPLDADMALPEVEVTPEPEEPVEPEAKAPAPVPEKTPEPEEPVEPEAIQTLFEFEEFHRAPGTTDEQWKEIQEAAEGMSFGGRSRKEYMKKLEPFELKAIPAVLNTLNGTDLADSNSWADAFEVAGFIQTLTHDAIKIPFRGDFSREPDVVRFNSKCISQMLDLWRERNNDPETFEQLAAKVAANKAAKEESGG